MGIFDSIKRKFSYDIKNRNGINEEYCSRYKVGKYLGKKYFRKHGRYHGKYQEFIYSESGVWADREITYLNGVQDGLTRYFWKKHIAAEGNFSNGKVKGVIKIYFGADELNDNKFIQIVKESADLDRGIYEVFNLGGKLLEKSKIDGVKFTEGATDLDYGCTGNIIPIRNGICKKWFENGQLEEKGVWENGQRQGEHIMFFENGQVKEKGVFDAGDIDDCSEEIHKFFYASGNIEFEIKYRAFTEEPSGDRLPIENWYNEDGSLMNINEIIEKGESQPLRRNSPLYIPGVTVACHFTGNKATFSGERFVFINNKKFRRLKYYERRQHVRFSLGSFHSYSRIPGVINSEGRLVEEQEQIIENQNMIPNEHLTYIPNNQNISENEKFNIKDESNIYEVIAEEREYYEVNNRENTFFGFWIDIHIQDEGLHIEGVDYYGDYPVIESKDEDDNYNYYLVEDIPYEVETENSVRFHHCDDFTTEESATRYLDNIKVMKYNDAVKKGLIPESTNNDKVIEKDKSEEYISVADELIKLNELKEKGILTEDEFNEQKKKLLKQ